MIAHAVTPILNVSDLAETVAWFEKLGWKKLWDWGDPPTFGAVKSGMAEIFLCRDGQGGRGLGTNKTTFGDEPESDKGAWMSIWVDNVDDVRDICIEQEIDITFGPENMPWGVRELHIRHPDGHVFRLSQGLGEHD